jgi:hypothetical protein
VVFFRSHDDLCSFRRREAHDRVRAPALVGAGVNDLDDDTGGWTRPIHEAADFDVAVNTRRDEKKTEEKRDVIAGL